MLSIVSESNFAPYNIATEEYLLREMDTEAFLLYINAPSIIVGMHQNSIAEINTDYVREHKIPVVRRLTGGGTVFHDLGNLNFCFIMNAEDENPWTFARYTAPILEVLAELGVKAELKGRNDLVIDDMKFSGNAKLVERGKILQHGTILYSSQMGALSAALKVNPLKFSDKAVKSVRSRVTNVADHMPNPLPLTELIALIRRKVHSMYPEARDYSFTPQDKARIQELCDTKYDTWEWNFGSSPKYNFSRAIRTPAGTIESYIDIHAGKIAELKIFGDFFSSEPTLAFEDAFKGTAHNESAILTRLRSLDLQSFFGAVEADDLIGLFF